MPRATKNTTDLASTAFAQYGSGLLRYLMRCRGCEQDADDLAQEVYIELLRVPEAEAVRQPQAYMFRIASHVVYRFKRRKQRESEVVSFDSETLDQLQDCTGDDANESAESQLDTEHELERLLKQLPPLYQAIIVMQKRDGLSYVQVAEKLGISVHTVKKYLQRALAAMRKG
jgi:RNA polymerase sigma-70 factor (ECF subfamily)